ncbi:MAG: DUF2244 domain-containing protein [Gammaproteobacteria bacterium]
MVYELGSTPGAEQIFVIRPNQAMSWRGLLIAYAAIAGTALTIAVACYCVGLTLVWPFSGLEVIALGVALTITSRRGDWREVITIGKDSIALEAGRQGPATRWEFHRQWTKVVLQRAGNSWYPSRLLLRSHGRQVEIGRFLNEQERQGFAEMLSGVIT